MEKRKGTGGYKIVGIYGKGLSRDDLNDRIHLPPEMNGQTNVCSLLARSQSQCQFIVSKEWKVVEKSTFFLAMKIGRCEEKTPPALERKSEMEARLVLTNETKVTNETKTTNKTKVIVEEE